MLPSKRRVQKELFEKTLKNSRFFNLPYFSIRCAKSLEKEELSRFSFVVSHKVASKAVLRNLLKRRGYSVIKDILPDIKKSFVVMFFFKKEAKNIPFLTLKEEIRTSLKKIGILE